MGLEKITTIDYDGAPQSRPDVQRMQAACSEVKLYLATADCLVGRADDKAFIFANTQAPKRIPRVAQGGWFSAIVMPDLLAQFQQNLANDLQEEHQRSLYMAWFDILYCGKPSAILRARDHVEQIVSSYNGIRYANNITRPVTEAELEYWTTGRANLAANPSYRQASDTCCFALFDFDLVDFSAGPVQGT